MYDKDVAIAIYKLSQNHRRELNELLEDKTYGRDLIFISRVKRDGSGVERVDNVRENSMRDVEFKMISLSVKEKTWLAVSDSTYIVKLR